MTEQLDEAGWSGPVAAGVVHQAAGPVVIVATADGLGLVPPRSRLPEGVVALTDLLPVASGADLLGRTDPGHKLGRWAETQPGLRFSAVVVSGVEPDRQLRVQTPDMTATLVAAGLVPPAVHAPTAEGKTSPVIAASVMHLRMSGSAEAVEAERAAALRALRWPSSGEQPLHYHEVLADWLISAAAVTEHPDQARWYAQQAADVLALKAPAGEGKSA